MLTSHSQSSIRRPRLCFGLPGEGRGCFAVTSLPYFKSADSGCYKLVASSCMLTKKCNKISRLFCFIYVSLSNISDRILKNVP